MVLTYSYKLLSPLIGSLVLTSSYLVVKHSQNKPISWVNPWICMPFVVLYSVYLWYFGLMHGKSGIVNAITCKYNCWDFPLEWFSGIVSGLITTAVFVSSYLWLLNTLKESFTFGEAGLIAQGFTLFLYQSLINMASFGALKRYHSNMQNSTLIIQVIYVTFLWNQTFYSSLQVGLTAILLLAYIVYKFNLKSAKVFYLLTILVCVGFIIIPLHLLLQQSPLVWIFSQVFTDITLVSSDKFYIVTDQVLINKWFQLKLFLYWSCCIVVAALAVSNQIFYAKRASTRTRKVFHVLAVLVYVPGLYLRCTFLYLASGVILGVFLFLEVFTVQLNNFWNFNVLLNRF